MITLNTNECTYPYQPLEVKIDKADELDYAIVELSVLITMPIGTGVLVDQNATRMSLNPKPGPGNGWTGSFYFGPNYISFSTNNQYVFGGPPVSMNELADEGIFTIVFKGQHDPPSVYSFNFFNVACYVYHLPQNSGTSYGPCYGNGNSGYLLSVPVHPAVSLSGNFKYQNNEDVGSCQSAPRAFPGLEVKILSLQAGPPGTEICSPVTDAAGDYSCGNIVPYCTYRILPDKTDHPGCGVDDDDENKIRDFILGRIRKFNTIWQYIAAEVSGDGYISTRDLIVIRSQILGIRDLPNPWAFIDVNLYNHWKNNGFPRGNIFYPEYVDVEVDENGMSGVDMYVIKMGDVTSDGTDDIGNCYVCDAQLRRGRVSTRSVGVEWYDPRIRDPQLDSGRYEKLKIRHQSKGRDVILSVPSKASGVLVSMEVEGLDEVEYEFLAGEWGTIDFYRPEGRNILRFLYLSKGHDKLANEDYIDIVRLRGRERQSVRVELETSPYYNYMVDEDLNSIALVVEDGKGIALKSLSPNPARDYTVMYFNQCVEEGLMELWIYDVSGKMAMYEEREIRLPSDRIKVDLREIRTPGLYVLRLKTRGGVFTKPLVIVK